MTELYHEYVDISRIVHYSTFMTTPESTPVVAGERVNSGLGDEIHLVCMGSVACRRVCDFMQPDAVSGPHPDSEIPGENLCEVLEKLDGVGEPFAVMELVNATALPRFESAILSSDEVSNEVAVMFEYLEKGNAAFRGLLEATLLSLRQPRFIVDAKKREYNAAHQEAPIDSSFADDKKMAIQVVRAQTRGFYDLQTLQTEGILFDGYARSIMLAMAEKMALGHHVSLSGEPGIAKTTLAKYVARRNSLAHHGGDTSEVEPVVLSFSSTSEAAAHLSLQTFTGGTLSEELGDIALAMQQGRGVILDEYNALTADQQILWNDLLLKKPGDTVAIAGRRIVIAPGFSVIATLNPMTDTQGNRRQGRQQQDSAGAARFERVDVNYPGSDAYKAAGGKSKEALSRLYMANWANYYGWWAPDPGELTRMSEVVGFIAELAKLATSPQQNGTGVLAQTAGMPLIAECITPRDFDRILGASFNASANPDVLDRAIAVKIDQLLASNNGHLLGDQAKSAVRELQVRYGVVDRHAEDDT